MVYFELGVQGENYERRAYNLINLMGDLGGFSSAVMSVVALLLGLL